MLQRCIRMHKMQVPAALPGCLNAQACRPRRHRAGPLVPRRRAQTTGGGGSGASTGQAGLWLEDDDATIAFGAAADASFGRAGAGVLHTAGVLVADNGVRVGTAEGVACDEANAGTIKWNPDPEGPTLMVCGVQNEDERAWVHVYKPPGKCDGVETAPNTKPVKILQNTCCGLHSTRL